MNVFAHCEMQRQAIVDIERVVNANAHRKHHHRQRRDSQADLELLHEPVPDRSADR